DRVRFSWPDGFEDGSGREAHAIWLRQPGPFDQRDRCFGPCYGLWLRRAWRANDPEGRSEPDDELPVRQAGPEGDADVAAWHGGGVHVRPGRQYADPD